MSALTSSKAALERVALGCSWALTWTLRCSCPSIVASWCSAPEPCCCLARMCQEKSTALSGFRFRGSSSGWQLGKEISLQIARTHLFRLFFYSYFLQMLFLCNRMLSSKTTSTGPANAHTVAAHQVLRLPTSLRDCLSIKEFILLLVQVGSTE